MFIKLPKWRPHFSRIIDGPAYFSYSVLEQPGLPYAYEVSEFFFAAELLAKTN